MSTDSRARSLTVACALLVAASAMAHAGFVSPAEPGLTALSSSIAEPNSSPVSVPGDINGDGAVDVVDLLYLVDAFGSSTGNSNYNIACDFDNDGYVDVADLLTFVDSWNRLALGPNRRKAVFIRNSANSTLGDWLHIYLTDPSLLAGLTSGSQIKVLDANGNMVPFRVLSCTVRKADIAVMMRPASLAKQTFYVVTGNIDPVPPMSEWRVSPMAPPASELPLSITTREHINPCTEAIHPNVLRVPPGSWMASDGLGGTVTHIMANTPYPNSIEAYENPSLLYSTDDGESWTEWPGIANPIDLPAPNSHLSDNCMAIRTDGSLMVMYRQRNTTTHEVTMPYRLLTGTSLSNVTLGDQQIATFETTTAHSPAIWQVSDNLWYCFGGEGTYSPTGPYSYYRWQSTDQGATWTDRRVALRLEGSQTAVCQGWWHGGQVVKVGNWYYMAESENILSTGLGISGNFRLWRSSDLEMWEPSSSLLLTALPNWAKKGRYYVPCLYLDSAGKVRMIFSAYDANYDPHCGLLYLGDLSENVSQGDAAEILGRGRDDNVTVPVPDLGAWDCQDGGGYGLVDCSGRGHDLVVGSGLPTYTPGLGYTLNRSNVDRLDTGVKLAGLTSFEIEMEFTTSAAFGPTYEVLLADSAGSSMRAMYLMMKNGQLYWGIWGSAGNSVYNSVAANLAVSTRYQVRVQYTPTRGLVVFLNGMRMGNAAKMGPVIDSGGQLTVGNYSFPTALSGSFTLHRLIVKSECNRALLEYAPTQEWASGHELEGANGWQSAQ